jgi:integrase
LTDAHLDGIERKPEGKRTARALDAHQVESVLRKIADPRDRTLFWLIYDGGLRCQEALAIDIDDISRSERSIRIHGKGNRPREMFFSRAVGTLLDKYLAARGYPTSGPLFVTHHKPVCLGVLISPPRSTRASHTGKPTRSGKGILLTGMYTNSSTQRPASVLPMITLKPI